MTKKIIYWTVLSAVFFSPAFLQAQLTQGSYLENIRATVDASPAAVDYISTHSGFISGFAFVESYIWDLQESGINTDLSEKFCKRRAKENINIALIYSASGLIGGYVGENVSPAVGFGVGLGPPLLDHTFNPNLPKKTCPEQVANLAETLKLIDGDELGLSVQHILMGQIIEKLGLSGKFLSPDREPLLAFRKEIESSRKRGSPASPRENYFRRKTRSVIKQVFHNILELVVLSDERQTYAQEKKRLQTRLDQVNANLYDFGGNWPEPTGAIRK